MERVNAQYLKEDRMKTLSVIVPVYNSEKYLQRCIDSILNSTYKDIELILVDDGSKDSSSQICDDNAKRDNRIKVIHQENAGISQARNNGIKIATGYYLALVDNDDYIDPTMYEKLIRCIEENDVDYAECGVNLVYPDKTFCDNEYEYEQYIFDTKKALELFDGDVRPYVWDKVFIREKTKNIKFRDGYGEDRYYVLDYLINNKKYMYINEPMYYWNRSNENSYTRSKFTENNLTYVDFYKYMSDICYNYNIPDTAIKYEEQYYIKLFVYYCLARKYKVDNYKKHMQKFYDDFHRQFERVKKVVKNKILLLDMRLFNRCPKIIGFVNGQLIYFYRKRRNRI